MLEADYTVPIRALLFGKGCDEFLDAAFAARCDDQISLFIRATHSGELINSIRSPDPVLVSAW